MSDATAMSKTLEDSLLKADSIEHYLAIMLGGLRVTKDAWNVINEVIEAYG